MLGPKSEKDNYDGQVRNCSQHGNPSYAIEKIGDWLRQSGSGAFYGDTPVQMLRKSLDAFRDEIAKTDPNDDIIKHEMPLAEYALDNFEAYINSRQSDIANDKVAEIFRDFLLHKWREYRQWATERDAE